MRALTKPELSWSQLRKYGVLLIAGYLALYVTWLFLGTTSRSEQIVIGGLATFFPAAAAASLIWWQRSQITSPPLRRAWSLLGAGVFLLAASDLFALLVEIGFNPVGLTQGLSNAAGLAGYPVILGGVVLYPHQVRDDAGRWRLFFDTTISSAALLILVWEIILQPLITFAKGPGALWANLYPFADLVLLTILMNIFLLTRPDRLLVTFRWLTAGLLLFSLSDLMYAYQAVQGYYHTGSLTDLGWVGGYCLISLGALFFPLLPESGTEEPIEGTRRKAARLIQAIEQSLQTLLPLLGTAAMGSYALINWSLNGQTDALGMWMTVLLSLGLVARQGVVTGERELQRYADLVNSIAEPAFICDRKGLLKLANPALLAALGYPEDSHVLNNCPVLHLFSPTSLPRNLLDAGLAGGWSGETILSRQDGTVFPAYLSLRPIDPGGREGLALAGTAHDLTIQKNQQAALQAAYEQIAAAHTQLEGLNEQLEQKVEEKTRNLSEAYQTLEQQNRTLQMLDEVKSDFVSMVSHELRAPLTNISGGIELVLGNPQPLPGSVASSLSLVQVEIRRLTHFVETILDLSALDADRMPLHPSPLLLADLVPVLRRQFEPLPGAERIHWEIPSDLPLIMADERALTSVFFHLIDNALKYAPGGEISIQVPEVDAQRVCLQICDHGPGIPDDLLPLLFDKFYRVHSGDAQTVYGHGLGLYIVRRLLNAMDSDIEASSRPGGGACFKFWLNVIEESDEREIASGG